MTQKRGHAHRRKLTDPLVPISGAHVSALLREAKLSEREAVSALRLQGVYTAQATLDHIIRGRQARCRASLRDGLVSLLSTPLQPEWLGGDHDLVWGAARHGRDLNERAGPGSAIGKAIGRARKRYGLTEGGLLRVSAGDPPVYELVAFRLVHDLEKARQQPFADEIDPAQLVRRLVSLTMWRRWLLPDQTGVIIEPEDMDRFAAAMGQAIRIALRPWLEDGDSIRENRLAALDAMTAKVYREVERTATHEAHDRLAEHRRRASGSATAL